ncbi:hypothetical protein T08_13825 [Trichinella sp. T8]|nr:hypothetical protein T08_13825 [Trichinella sp. T8]
MIEPIFGMVVFSAIPSFLLPSSDMHLQTVYYLCSASERRVTSHHRDRVHLQSVEQGTAEALCLVAALVMTGCSSYQCAV